MPSHSFTCRHSCLRFLTCVVGFKHVPSIVPLVFDLFRRIQTCAVTRAVGFDLCRRTQSRALGFFGLCRRIQTRAFPRAFVFQPVPSHSNTCRHSCRRFLTYAVAFKHSHYSCRRFFTCAASFKHVPSLVSSVFDLCRRIQTRAATGAVGFCVAVLPSHSITRHHTGRRFLT